MSEESLDYYLPLPSIMSHMDPRKPLCNMGGKPKKPEPPPPIVAPVRADKEDGFDNALKSRKNRKGLRSTILQRQTLNPVAADSTLGQSGKTALGMSTQ